MTSAFGADFVRAQFAVNFLRAGHKLLVAVQRQHADRLGREPAPENDDDEVTDASGTLTPSIPGATVLSEAC
jgi:hypothetical protein